MTRRSGDTAGTDGQLSLLHGFSAAKLPSADPERAAVRPVAHVILDAQLPHLDRVFDYSVPAVLAADAQPGVRVKVRFAGREHTGFVAARADAPSTTATLFPLLGVISPLRVLTPEILAVAEAVAARSVGTVSDVLRVAVPPRMARVEKEFPADLTGDNVPDQDSDQDSDPDSDQGTTAGTRRPASSADESETPAGPGSGGFLRYPGGAAYLHHLANGESPRAVLTSLGGYGSTAWTEEITDAVAATVGSGRSAVVVVPDQRDLARVEAVLAARLGGDTVARLTAEDGATPRYRNFLRLLHGTARVAVGTRSAAYAPVRDLGLVCLWDDGDDQHLEQRAPYQHVRDVLLLRADQENAGMLLTSFARSTEAQRLVDTGWARALQAERAQVRRATPRVVHASDAYQMERDPLAAQARIPHAAWAAAQAGLTSGPVLLQVARTGFSPALACDRCRHAARCPHCAGPLAQRGRDAPLACGWCGRPDHHWVCPECGGQRIRATVAGATRTAEELGRAFPGMPVLSSAGEHILDAVPDAPAVVVATPGAEPIAPRGYAAVILLDGNAMLSRESLRAGEDALRRWFSAAILARPSVEGGTVVITGDDDVAVGHLVRWDPVGAAAREVAERQQLGLPPTVRYAVLTGSREGLVHFLEGVELDGSVRVVGPTPLPLDPRRDAMLAARTAPGRGKRPEREVPPASPTALEGQGSHRLLLFFPYRAAAGVTALLRSRRAALSARRTGDPVHIRLDPVDVL